MLTKFFRIVFICIIIFYHNILYSKNLDPKNFNEKNVSNYFSALVSLNNNQNNDSLKFFNSSKFLKESHELYLKKYLFSLVLNGKVSKAVKEIKTVQNKNLTNFFEADLLLLIDSLKKKKYKKSLFYINNLKLYKSEGTFEYIISSVLEDYIYVFNNNKINANSKENFGKLTIINAAFQNCYLGDPNTNFFFNKIINSSDGDYERYLFFYINFLLNKKKNTEAQTVAKIIDPLNSSLLATQSKKWIDDKKFENFENIFSCKNSNDIISEFFFLIANLYSTEGHLGKSNFYLNISNYLNPKFKFNLSLFVENYFTSKNFRKAEKILDDFNKENEIYYWYKIKRKAHIIKKKKDKEKSFDYLNSKFNAIHSPSLRMIFDMGNIAKGFKKYNISIKYYSNVLLKLDPETLTYADVLYRRGGSYERLGNAKKSDEDLLKSLEINLDDPYVMNYLAYSWLERNYKIDKAIQMLEKAYQQKINDPYIIDSIGWGYYLVGNFSEAEKILKRAVELMPNDPIVNDHYGDILWKLGRKIQATYFWKNVLNFEDAENEMKEKIYFKLLQGV